ncbi:alpha/beta fold hydrolase [Corynebacterium kozikiae]|uniref:alpha/beta fold hydrolase n=1 Tax=Corynebacterium kozikiae TaxID=2968469 RepID=UPI00211C4D1B|nr:alpha/beta hydrolase [Corynebacterium sp. 76QC2CO]
MLFARLIPPMGVLPTSPQWVEGAAPPVVFLHGVLGSPGNFERPAAVLAAQGRAFFAPAYGNHGTAALERSYAELEKYFAGLRRQGIGRVDIVGHSAGGHMGLHIAHAFPGMVRRLVGLGAAYRGTPRRLLSAPGMSPAVRLLLGDALLGFSRPFEAQAPEGVEVLSVYSTNDFVVPQATATLGATYEIVGPRHDQLPRLANLIVAALEVEDVEQFKVPRTLW